MKKLANGLTVAETGEWLLNLLEMIERKLPKDWQEATPADSNSTGTIYIDDAIRYMKYNLGAMTNDDK